MAESGAGEPKIPGAIRRLSDALWGQAGDDISHAECRAVLPQYVEAEVAGEDAAARYPRVRHHLDHCQECGEEYAMLVDLELAEQAGELELTRELPSPAFSYQAAETPQLQRILVEWTRTWLAILAPPNLGDVEAAADTLFAALKPRQAFESRAAYGQALGIGGRTQNPALTLLAAGFATTQELKAQVSLQQFNAWLAQNTLGAELETRAEATARGIGLDPMLARDFGRAFAQVVMQDPRTLRNLLA